MLQLHIHDAVILVVFTSYRSGAGILPGPGDPRSYKYNINVMFIKTIRRYYSLSGSQYLTVSMFVCVCLFTFSLMELDQPVSCFIEIFLFH